MSLKKSLPFLLAYFLAQQFQGYSYFPLQVIIESFETIKKPGNFHILILLQSTA